MVTSTGRYPIRPLHLSLPALRSRQLDREEFIEKMQPDKFSLVAAKRLIIQAVTQRHGVAASTPVSY
jgi:hypothetical protein